jgi:hypothetical protein
MTTILQLTIDEAEEKGLQISNQSAYIKLNGEIILVQIIDKNGNIINNQRKPFLFGKSNVRNYTKKEIDKMRVHNIIIRIDIKSKIKYDIKMQRKLLGKPLGEILENYCGHYNFTYFSSKNKKNFECFEITCWNVNFIPMEGKNISKGFKKILEKIIDNFKETLEKNKIKYKIKFAGPLKGKYEDYICGYDLLN